jgi:hypothetical protein
MNSTLTVAPQQIIGYVNGRPVRAIAGGSEPAGEPPAAPEGNGQPPSAVTPPAPAAPAEAPGEQAAERVEDLPEWAQRRLRDLGQENGKRRIASKQVEDELQELRERNTAILKAAGIDTGEEDPVKALEATRAELGAKGDALYDAQIKLAMVDACDAAGADRKLTTAVLALDGKLDDLDPTSDDFASTLSALVEAAVKSDPKLKASQAPAASGISTPGGPGPAADIDAAIEAATKAGDHATAIRLKRQKAYAPHA